jgi:predicted ribosomally synthesized peptide with nif11-like leader
MSVENVKAFFEKAAEDESLQEKLKALAEREETIYADLVDMASAAGFQFTTADARKARMQTAQELSDEELEAAAGGRVRPVCVVGLHFLAC